MVKAQGRDHQYGPPYLHLYYALIEYMEGVTEMEMSDKSLIASYLDDHLGEVDMLALADDMKYCKVSKTYKKDVCRFQFAITEHQPYTGLERAIHRALALEKGTRQLGAAPRIALERDAQKIIDKLQSK